MEAKLLDIVAKKTSDPQQLADLEELRLYALAVANVEQNQVLKSERHELNRAVLDDIESREESRGRVYGLQSRFCRRADSAIEAVESIVGFERDELEFLNLLSELASQHEQARLEPLLRSKEQLVVGMELFVDTYK